MDSIVENLCFCEHQSNCHSESYSLEDINSQMRKIWEIDNLDSTVALSWIRGYAKQWKPFVSNRVHEIQDLTNPQNWRFEKGEQNPADIVSRGCSAEELKKNSRFWHGPH
ncbi:integrase catalytic domain-containing protein [Trichonephila clavata]|uniref:Integrase catalytic domain-containing protein n=1 Tax=Trichonephila clavata TaxID=2740835 RepID=A0A8X6L5J1_TRICU|nr:integrase catalytic domain-containing protein [Trichonephila clavata]